MFTKCLNTHYIYDKRATRGVHRICNVVFFHNGVLEQAGGAEQHNMIKAASHELKLGGGG